MADDKQMETDSGNKVSTIAGELLQNPAVLAALQSRLSSMVGQSSDYIQSLPPAVKRRIKALKKLQFEAIKTEAKFFEEVHALEVKYHKMYLPLYEKRREITTGEHEPADDEADWASDEDNEEELSDEVKAKAQIGDTEKKDAVPVDVKGVPEFWLTIFKNVDMICAMLQDHDQPILSHLTDIAVELSSEPMGFTLKFHFSQNEYFSDAVLTKSYEMTCAPDENDPFDFEGPEIVKCQGCTINWKAGKNVTIKTIKKKQKHKSKGSVRTVTKTVTNDSFFNFFNPPTVNEGEEVDEDSQTILTADFEIGHYIRERLVPRAVLYFTGEALEDEDYDEDEDEDEDEEGEEGDGSDEEADEDFDPAAAAKKGIKPGQNPAECKQQ